LYEKIILETSTGVKVDEEYAKLRFLRSQINEITDLLPWTYDYPSMLKLIGGGIISLLIFTVNVYASSEYF
jgi:hypothetical protein